MANTSKQGTSGNNQSGLDGMDFTQDLQSLKNALENMGTNVFMADANRKLIYINKQGRETLQSVSHIIRKVFNVDASDLIGRSIHDFHSDPGRIENILANPANFPRQADIVFDEVVLETNINVVTDSDGNIMGHVVNWEEVGAARRALAQAQQLKQMVESSPMPCILADEDFNITYMNPISEKTLQKVEQYLPVRASEVVGQNIDIFHKDPSHQRNILSNPKANLPYRADILVGPEKLELLVSAIFDESGKFVGPMVNWEIVTERRAAEAEAAKKSAMVENSPINTMFADRDCVIEYVNPATRKNLQPLAEHLPIPIDKVVGANIDIFHKNPSHQRALLADPNNLPHQAHIKVADQTLDLLASAIYDHEGEYIGAMVTWSNITEQLAMEAEQRRMQQEAEDNAKTLQDKVSQLLGNVKAAAQGDLTTAVNVKGADAIGQLGEGIEQMIEGLKTVISQIVEAADQFTEGARVVSEGSTSLSDGAQTQSANVEQMSASVQSLNQMITGVADNAKSANEVAGQTSERAEQGGEAVSKNIEAMKLIDKSAEQIAEIIGVISEIAAQTNLLALNAAIEAARAGEHGLGFAVVADEVRKLAERSSEAAKEINQLIKESTQRVKEGAELSEKTGQALQKIIEGVEETAKGISQIAEATNEQAQTATEVSTGIQNVASITENNASAAEEMSGSAEELAGQSNQLKELVAQFKL
ncbi:MAG: methyl-accepting chemotaxis protein [Phycisphaerae bacterium]